MTPESWRTFAQKSSWRITDWKSGRPQLAWRLWIGLGIFCTSPDSTYSQVWVQQVVTSDWSMTANTKKMKVSSSYWAILPQDHKSDSNLRWRREMSLVLLSIVIISFSLSLFRHKVYRLFCPWHYFKIGLLYWICSVSYLQVQVTISGPNDAPSVFFSESHYEFAENQETVDVTVSYHDEANMCTVRCHLFYFIMSGDPSRVRFKPIYWRVVRNEIRGPGVRRSWRRFRSKFQ